eukprot:tig00000093_g3443.t1
MANSSVRELIAFLETVPSFLDVKRSTLRAFAELATVRRLRTGDELAAPGLLYVLLEGSLVVEYSFAGGGAGEDPDDGAPNLPGDRATSAGPGEVVLPAWLERLRAADGIVRRVAAAEAATAAEIPLAAALEGARIRLEGLLPAIGATSSPPPASPTPPAPPPLPRPPPPLPRRAWPQAGAGRGERADLPRLLASLAGPLNRAAAFTPAAFPAIREPDVALPERARRISLSRSQSAAVVPAPARPRGGGGRAAAAAAAARVDLLLGGAAAPQAALVLARRGSERPGPPARISFLAAQRLQARLRRHSDEPPRGPPAPARPRPRGSQLRPAPRPAGSARAPASEPRAERPEGATRSPAPPPPRAPPTPRPRRCGARAPPPLPGHGLPRPRPPPRRPAGLPRGPLPEPPPGHEWRAGVGTAPRLPPLPRQPRPPSAPRSFSSPSPAGPGGAPAPAAPRELFVTPAAGPGPPSPSTPLGPLLRVS